MDVEALIREFERKLILQRYSTNSIRNYISSVKSFLELARKKFAQPDEIDEEVIEKDRKSVV